jgi:DNA-binding SARP family transcriptional activator/tetratricopeptide (TPR) repeat protein
MVRYAILGPVELRDGGRRVSVGGPRQVALLALLLLNANRALSNDRLIDALWGDLGPAGAVKRVQAAILRLRRALDRDGASGEPVLRTVADGYLLAVGPGELDAEVFQTRVREGGRLLEDGEAQRARDVLSEALGLWRGPALAEVAYEEFAQPEIRRLEELRLAAFEARVDCELQLGTHRGVIGELDALVAGHPGREHLALQLMLALYRCGRQGDALDVYARTRAYLSAELGLEPGPALRSLHAGILAQSPALQWVRAEPGAGAGDPNIPAGPVALALPRSLRSLAGVPFVGREAELTRLRERWTQVCGGSRAALVIGGEAGIGKTRLAGELARAVHEQGALVLYGRCDEGLAAPYQPFVEALRPYARAVGLDRLRAELGQLAPELGRLLPELAELGEPVRADPESERFALFDAVAALVEAMTREQRALLIVDDLHWAAKPTLLLLRHLIRSERRLGALVLCICRETELDPSRPLAQMLADVHRDDSAQHLSLHGLDESAIAVLLEAAVGHPLDERASQLVRALGTQTSGNPFFIRELLAHLAESDTLAHASGRSSPAVTGARLEAPEGLRQVIGQRVARLSAPARRALSVAAVAGPTFSFVVLERVLRCDVLDALDEAVAAALLTDAGHGDYAFAHALVRQTIYGQLGSLRRTRLHRQLGEALEAGADAHAHVEALAHHFACAAADGRGDKAATYALAAGRSATARLGHEEAVAHYERGLDALALSDLPQDRRRCELLLALGEARWNTGELNGARQAYRQASELAEQLGDATSLARAALGFCGPLRFEAATAVTEPVTGLLERALAGLSDEDSALRAQLTGRLAVYAQAAHRKPVLAREALEMARRVGNKATLADVLASSLWVTRGPGGLDESLAMATELARVADEVGDSRLRARAHGRLLDHLLELGDIEGVQRELASLQRLAETRQDRYIRWILTVLQANHAHLQGRLERFEKLSQQGLEQRFEGHDDAAAQTFRTQIVLLRREQGRLDELVETVEEIAAHYPQLPGWRCAVANIYAQLGRTEQARRELEALARADFEDVPRDAVWFLSMWLLAEVAVFLRDRPRALLLYDLLLPYADRCMTTSALLCYGSAARPLGMLATMLSRFEDAARHFEQALAMNAQIRSPLWVAHTRYDYAHMLLARGQPGDNGKALELLEQALAAARELGLKALADKARPLKLMAEAVPYPAAVHGPA